MSSPLGTENKVMSLRDAIRAQCGWDLRVAPSLKRVAPPQAEEIALLRTMDPQGKFTGSHRSVERRS